MKLLEAMTTYFHGERLEALVFILPMGVASLVFGGWLVSQHAGGFARGVAIPFLVLGLLLTVVGGIVGFRTPSQVAALQASLQASPDSALAAEQARMEKVNAAWPVYLGLWAAFGVVGLGLRFGTRSDFTQGIGVALVLFAGVGLLIDGFAERRARPYTDALAAENPRTGSP